MKPGRELDALVAEKVMGWRAHSPGYPSLVDINGVPTGWLASGQGSQGDDPDFRPSTDIAAAWEVVERLGGNMFQLHYDTRYGHENKTGWAVILDGVVMCGFADTAPHAICLAALKAAGVITD